MTLAITAKKRDAGNAERDREQGLVPAVLYGPDIESVSIGVDPLLFEKLYNEAGESTLIDLTIEGQSEPTKVLVQDIQYDTIKERFIHIDFRQIKMGEEMQATAELTFIGESAAVKALGGTLNKQRESLDIKCLPKNLVNHIDVDISTLATFEDAIYIKDLSFPDGITSVDDMELLVAKVTAPLSEEQLAAMEESAVGDVEAVEVDGEKVDGEAAEGGAVAPAEEKKAEEGGEKKEG